MFASTFVISTSTVAFGALVMGHQDRAGPLRSLELDCHFQTEAAWNTFRGFVNWDMDVIPMPWGNTVEIVVKGGPGSGTLTIPGLTPTTYTAWLSAAQRSWRSSSGQTNARCTFIFSAT